MARIGPRNLMVAGMSAIVGAFVLLAVADDHAAYFPWLLSAYALLGLGGGMTFLPLLIVSMSEVAPHEAGLASGFRNATQQVGGALGLAALGTVATNHAYQLGFLLAAGVVTLALAVVVTTLRSSRIAGRSVGVVAPGPEGTEAEAA